MEEVLVSIITPVYNGEEFIDRYFSAIDKLKYELLQIILVNDGSTDHSSNKILQYQEKDSRIIFINKPTNQGVSSARNDALEIAEGKYIFFFDIDDIFDEGIIQTCVGLAEENAYDCICYGYATVKSDGYIFPHQVAYEKDEYVNSAYDVARYSFGLSYDDIYDWLKTGISPRRKKELNGPWRMMYSRAVIHCNKMRFDENLRIGEDTIFTNEYLCLCHKVGIIRETLYFLISHENSTIAKYNSDPCAMQGNKIDLIKAKKRLTEKLETKVGDFENLWGGEYVLSSVQLAVMWCKLTSFGYGIQKLKEFHLCDEVQACWNKLSLKKIICFNIRCIPLILLKMNACLLCMVLLKIANKIGIEIKV